HGNHATPVPPPPRTDDRRRLRRSRPALRTVPDAGPSAVPGVLPPSRTAVRAVHHPLGAAPVGVMVAREAPGKRRGDATRGRRETTMIDQASVPSLMGSTVRDSAGEKIGKVGQVYLDDTTGQPEWVTVRTGLFGTKESFVPLAAARVEGDELVVDIPKSKVHDAPRIDEEGHLSEEQETELYTYYGVSQGPFGRQTPTETGPGYVATGMAAGTGMTAGTGTAAGLAAGEEADPTGTP